MKISQSCKRTSNFLKKLVNKQCEDGFEWFEDVKEDKEDGIGLYDLLYAIEELDKIEDRVMEIVDA